MTLDEMRDREAIRFAEDSIQGPETKEFMNMRSSAKVGLKAGFDFALKTLREMGGEFPEEEFKVWYQTQLDMGHPLPSASDIARWAWAKAQAQVLAWKHQAQHFEKVAEEHFERSRRNIERIQELEARLKKAEGVIEFYADRDNWVTNSGKVGVTPIWVDDQDSPEGPQYSRWSPGRRARAFLRDKGE